MVISTYCLGRGVNLSGVGRGVSTVIFRGWKRGISNRRQSGQAVKELACEQALLFGRVKRVSRERASERRSREGPAKGRPPRSCVLARLTSLNQKGELARRLLKN